MQMSYIKLASEMKMCFSDLCVKIFKMRLQICNKFLQNYARAICWSLLDLTTNIVLNSNVYKLRGVVIFHGGERCGLRAATGHYTTCALRSNEKWESYDDTKLNVTSSSTTRKKDIELLFYSL